MKKISDKNKWACGTSLVNFVVSKNISETVTISGNLDINSVVDTFARMKNKDKQLVY